MPSTDSPALCRVYPAKELRAIDMAEILRAAYSFDGVISGCRFTLDDSGNLKMTPGRMMLGGRLGEFILPEDAIDGKITIPLPAVQAAGDYYICAVCDLSSSEPFYIRILSESAKDALPKIDTTSQGSEHYNFNVSNGKRGVVLGKIRVAPGPRATSMDVSTGTYPGYAIRTNANVIDGIVKTEGIHWETLSQWKNYFQYTKHRSAFFRNGTIEANGLKIPAGESRTYSFRAEYGSQVLMWKAGETPSFPATAAYVWIDPTNGDIHGQAKDRSDRPREVIQIPDHGVPNGTKLNDQQLNRGIVGIKISNASSGGAQAENCIVQSYGLGGTDNRYVVITIKNLGKAAAVIKVRVTCLYVQNSNYPDIEDASRYPGW